VSGGTARTFALLGAFASTSMLVAMVVGGTWFTPAELVRVAGAGALGDAPDPITHAILVDLRLPRVVGMFVVGALLAASGALLQLVLATPLADPYVLGASGGAGVGALLAIWLGFATLAAPAAFVGALAATLLTLQVGRSIGGSPVHLLLAGLCVSAMTGALLAMLLLATSATSRGATPALAWLLGGVVPADWSRIAFGLAALATCTTVALALGRDVDSMTLGDVQARSLGVRPGAVQLTVVIACAFATAAAVSLAGLVGFVGALVPIATRAWLPAGARTSVPACALVGGAVLVLVDAVARSIVAPVELPTGVVAACIGAPVVVLLVRGEAVTRARI
jgi:iron complex transport system permease protein